MINPPCLNHVFDRRDLDKDDIILFDRFDIMYNAGNINELDISFIYLSYVVKNGPKLTISTYESYWKGG